MRFLRQREIPDGQDQRVAFSSSRSRRRHCDRAAVMFRLAFRSECTGRRRVSRSDPAPHRKARRLRRIERNQRIGVLADAASVHVTAGFRRRLHARVPGAEEFEILCVDRRSFRRIAGQLVAVDIYSGDGSRFRFQKDLKTERFVARAAEMNLFFRFIKDLEFSGQASSRRSRGPSVKTRSSRPDFPAIAEIATQSANTIADFPMMRTAYINPYDRNDARICSVGLQMRNDNRPSVFRFLFVLCRMDDVPATLRPQPLPIGAADADRCPFDSTWRPEAFAAKADDTQVARHL